jgi:PAC2 family
MLTIELVDPGGAVLALPPEQLFTLEADPPDLRGPAGEGPVMIEMLDGFVDAGAARQLARDHLLAALPTDVVARFDTDLLFDYRARRPPMLFVEDHWESYDPPRLELRAARDETGRPFLLLAGPEPDVMWDRFAAAVELLVERFGVRVVIGTNAIPMAVPHTRPVGITAHSARKDLIEGYPAWVGTVQVPGSASALLEHRLAGAGHTTMGFAVHVPHYLAQSAYAPASLALVRAVANAGGLALPVAALETAAQEAQDTIAGLLSQSDELAELVRGLEAQYDAFVANRDSATLTAAGPLPSADEIGAELERFLAEQNKRRGDNPGTA